MSWIIGGIIGSSLISGAMGSNAASDMADASTAATGTSIAEQRRQFDINQANQAPFLQAGTNAIGEYSQALGLPYLDQNAQAKAANLDAQIAALQKQIAGLGSENKAGPDNAYHIIRRPNQIAEPAGQLSELNNKLRALQDERSAIQLFAQPDKPHQGAALDYNGAPPTFSYTGAPPTLDYGGAPPSFNYLGQIPQYADNPGFSFDPSQLGENPGYQFMVGEAMKAVDRAMAKGGFYKSGNRLSELQRTAEGMAAQEYQDEFGRQLGAYNTNTANYLSNFANKANVEDRQYGRTLQDYQINAGNEAANYGRAMDRYQIDTGNEATNYGRALQGYQINAGNEATNYGRSMDRYNIQQADQNNYLNRLAALSGVGQTAANQVGAIGASTAANIGNAAMNDASNQGAASSMKYGSWNNAIQGGLGNYMGYMQNQNLLSMLGNNRTPTNVRANDGFIVQY